MFTPEKNGRVIIDRWGGEVQVVLKSLLRYQIIIYIGIKTVGKTNDATNYCTCAALNLKRRLNKLFDILSSKKGSETVAAIRLPR